MDAQDHSKPLITIYHSMQHLIPEDCDFVTHSCENLKFHDLAVTVNDRAMCKLSAAINTS
jgi:hypothetical protein